MDKKSNEVKGLAALIMVVSAGTWTESAAADQAKMYLDGWRDGRIADVTFHAVILAKEIGNYNNW